MKAIKAIIALFLIIFTFTANAQVARETSFGVSYGRNLRFTNRDTLNRDTVKVRTIVSAKAEASFNDYEAFGSSFELLKQYKYANYGFGVGSENSKEFGWANRAYIFGGVNTRSDKFLSCGLKVAAGYGMSHITTYMSDDFGHTHKDKNSTLKPFLAPALNINLLLSKKVTLSLEGGLRYSFVKSSDDDEQVLYGTWNIDKQETDASRYYCALNLSHNMNYKTQISGDNCWNMEGVYGNSNLGQFAGVKAIHFKRTGATWGRVLGFGSQWTFGDKDPLNEIFAQGGVRWEPWGAESILLFDLGITAGMGEFPQNDVTSSATEEGSIVFQSRDNYCSFGVDAKAYAEVSANLGDVLVGVGCNIGTYKCIGNNYKGLEGDEGKTSGALRGYYAKVSIAF